MLYKDDFIKTSLELMGKLRLTINEFVFSNYQIKSNQISVRMFIVVDSKDFLEKNLLLIKELNCTILLYLFY